ncbi:nudC domain-containing protein 1 [Musca vetustissima]|uniref:nudC domain-containing protein 1 n=1 Tax=Musca vetustissima TaxID=27455 RepID=UPI002AB79A36|nr:nudC domain-containing protein 1 [Musca vetustissima]
MPKIVELRQDRSLIRSNFDGYKLSLDPVPLIRQELTAAPLKATPNDDQYSLLHVELFSMQNLLVVDPWSRNDSYFINNLGEVVRCSYDENRGRPNPMQVVYRIGGGGETSSDEQTSQPMWKPKGEYNNTFRFISEKYCVLCDGVKSLFLLETGDRFKSQEWQKVATATIEGHGLDPDEKNYVINDARLDIVQEQKQISLALGHVQRVESQTPDGGSTHFMYLHWAKWHLKEQKWTFEILDTLEGKGSLYYCAFEPRSESLILSSNREYKWRSKKASDEAAVDATIENKPQLHDKPENEISGFSWSQTDEDIIVKFDDKPGVGKTDYSIKCMSNKITVKYKETPILDCELREKIDPDLTTWTIENNFLQVTLVKQDSGLYWPSLLANDLGPKENTDGKQQNCLPMEQQPIANLETPIEDCDFPMGMAEEEITIARYNMPSKDTTHSVIMSSSPPLFTTSLRPGFPLAIATRQDVDCSLWLQQFNPTKPEEWSLRHEGNLHAFAYVQASKQQKKFIDCSPDLGYAIISESHRHVFLYKSKYDTASGLRNRNGPQVSIGKQHLITLEDAGEILGLTTANAVATLLTEKCVLFVQIDS